MSKRVLSLFILFIIAGLSGPAAALETQAGSVDHIEGRLVTGVEAAGDGGAIEAMVELELEQGWHTYWHHPGDAGLPPRFDWSGSDNLAGAEISWPPPVRKLELDFNVFAYEGTISFPIKLDLKEPGKPARIALKADVMVCHDICIPQTLNFMLDIPAGQAAESPQAGLIKTAREALPKPDNTSVLAIEGVVAGPEGLVVTVTAEKLEGADVFVTAGDLALTAPPVVTLLDETGRKALIKITPPQDVKDLPTFLAGKELKVLLVVGSSSIERTVTF